MRHIVCGRLLFLGRVGQKVLAAFDPLQVPAVGVCVSSAGRGQVGRDDAAVDAMGNVVDPSEEARAVAVAGDEPVVAVDPEVVPERAA